MWRPNRALFDSKLGRTPQFPSRRWWIAPNPMLDSDLVHSLPFPAPVSPPLLAAAIARDPFPSACGVRLDGWAIHRLHFHAMPLDAQEDFVRSGHGSGSAAAHDVFLERDSKRFAALIFELLLAGDKRAALSAGLLLLGEHAPNKVPMAVLEEMGLALQTPRRRFPGRRDRA